MKPVYLGGVRGYQSAVYRPGMGWSATETHRHHGHRPPAPKANQPMRVSPLAVASRRGPGVRTKTAIVAVMVALAGVLTLVLSGAVQF
ncbi:MAG: hypothetical protein JXA87_07545 [Thermoleophilia bacterium]|nr:hypothetical protein [Thermoleophilia bacterium]